MTELIIPPPWTEAAVCASADPEAWFPEKGQTNTAAKKVCGACTVREECLAWALEHSERFGVWGGMSERERRRMARGEPVADKVAPPGAPCPICSKPTRNRAMKVHGGDCTLEWRRRQTHERQERMRAGAAAVGHDPLSIDCPFCGEPAGQRCLSGAKRISVPHLARFEAPGQAAA